MFTFLSIYKKQNWNTNCTLFTVHRNYEVRCLFYSGNFDGAALHGDLLSAKSSKGKSYPTVFLSKNTFYYTHSSFYLTTNNQPAYVDEQVIYGVSHLKQYRKITPKASEEKCSKHKLKILRGTFDAWIVLSLQTHACRHLIIYSISWNFIRAIPITSSMVKLKIKNIFGGLGADNCSADLFTNSGYQMEMKNKTFS